VKGLKLPETYNRVIKKLEKRWKEEFFIELRNCFAYHFIRGRMNLWSGHIVLLKIKKIDFNREEK